MSKEQLLLPGIVKFTESKYRITDWNLLKVPLVGMRGSRLLPKCYYPVKQQEIPVAKRPIVQLNYGTSQPKSSIALPKLPPNKKMRLDKASSRARFPYKSNLRISSL